MTRLVAILVTLFLTAIPAKANVTLWPRPVPGWTVIQVYGEIKPADVRAFVSYTKNVNPDATLVIVTGPGGDLLAGIDMGRRIRQKKLIVGVMGACASSCALMWMGGETGRKFFYQNRPDMWVTSLCFHQPYEPGALNIPLGHIPVPSASGIAKIDKYLADLGYNRDIVAWATTADPKHRECLTSELAKKFNIDAWSNTEDGQHHTLPGNHGLLPTTSGY
jgi:hypothetical protein